MSEKKVPICPYTETDGLVYFARSLNKIRLHTAGELREDFQANLGKAIDAFMCDYLRIDYPALRDRTLQGGTDAEVLAWVQETSGRDLSPIDKRVWNHFVTKLGWKDDMTDRFEFRRNEAGLKDNPHVLTIFDVLDYDEGRK
ncbi:DUF5069 domain-containing protein [Actomonas aquatica]|uniref:DUF5069 domain-containing protein n=1 Tax=Actomonas aquatica TaxID=2866162 RepID=A0ABZ1CDB0_9BACT|nr:DUF5069 domain-containing protein [Opitutus sp. WL0086]WRQ88614.1 DUF5069 domain-containing protein [Opitutus sp. WL0086]